jgi:dipeptidyl aminopeptidase/acylaminoacyl peptidase
MAMKRVSDPQISPSGKWVMFSVTDVSLEKNTKVNHLWVVPLREESGGTTPPKQSLDGAPAAGGERQITFGEGEAFGRFSPDGKTVSLTMKDQIFEMAWDEAKGTVGKAIQVTNVEGGADGAVWSPDSKRLMFVAGVWPECSVKVQPTLHGEAMKDGPPNVGGRTRTNTEILTGGQNDELKTAAVVGGTRDVAAWKGAEAVGWAEEDACDKAKDAAVAATPVKGQVWDGLLYRHWEHYTGAQRSHVLVVDADSGRNLRDLTPASVVGDAETPTFFVGGAQNYAWAPDSKEIAYVTNLDAVPAASTNNDVFTLRLDEDGAKAVKVSTSPGSDDGPAYSPDGKWLAFRSQARGGFESDKSRLMRYSRLSKEVDNLLPRFDGWVDEFAWSKDCSQIIFVSGNHGESPVYFVGLGREDLGKVTRYTIPGEFAELQIADDGSMVATQMLANRPSEVVHILLQGYSEAERTDSSDGAALVSVPIEPLSHLNQAIIADLSLAAIEPFWFTGAEGTKVEGFIMKPPGFDPAKKYAVKFLMHGGPQTAWGDAWSYRWNWELMAANGYVVVGINRRGSTGYGQKFVDEVSGDWGGRAYEDLMKGLDYVEAKYPFVDKTRECALGASYGGYMADWVLTHTNRFKCIVTHDGMYDPVAAYGTTEELWFNEWEFRRPEDFPKGWDGLTSPPKRSLNGAPKIGGGTKTTTQILTGGQNDGRGGAGKPGQPWRYAGLAADQDPFRKWAPMRFVQNAKTPTLVIHSQKDYRLDVSQGFELFTALQRLGVPSKMLYFPDESHWVLKPQDSQVWNEVVGDWCDRWTKSGKWSVVSGQ